MKRFISIIVLTVVVFALSSCSGTKTDNSKEYLFSVSDGVLYKYNVHTGYRTTVCNDPLCKHDENSNCMFYDIGEEVFWYKNTVLYYKENTLYQYNPEKQSAELLYEAGGNILYMYLTNNLLFFDSVVFDYSPDADHPVSVDIIRYDLSKASAEKLNKDTLYDIQCIDLVVDDRLIWHDSGIQNMYSTDLDYGSRETIDYDYYGILAGNRSYKLELSSTSPLSFNLVFENNGQKEIALKDIVSVKGYDNSLIVTYNRKENKYIGKALDENGKEIEIYEYQSNDLYIYDQNGENGKLLCRIPDDKIIYSFNTTYSTLDSGDYIGVLLKEYEFGNNGFITDYKVCKDIAIVNIKTGEVTISKG